MPARLSQGRWNFLAVLRAARQIPAAGKSPTAARSARPPHQEPSPQQRSAPSAPQTNAVAGQVPLKPQPADTHLSVVINVIHNVSPKPSTASKPTITNQPSAEEWSQTTAYASTAGCAMNASTKRCSPPCATRGRSSAPGGTTTIRSGRIQNSAAEHPPNSPSNTTWGMPQNHVAITSTIKHERAGLYA